MTIPAGRLPQTCTVKRPPDPSTVDDYGEVGGSLSTLYTGVPCRLTRNKHYNMDAQFEAGYVSKSTHLIFMNLSYGVYPSLAIRVGDQITIGTEIFIVQYPDSAPGGREGHHQQIYADHQLTSEPH